MWSKKEKKNGEGKQGKCLIRGGEEGKFLFYISTSNIHFHDNRSGDYCPNALVADRKTIHTTSNL